MLFKIDVDFKPLELSTLRTIAMLRLTGISSVELGTRLSRPLKRLEDLKLIIYSETQNRWHTTIRGDILFNESKDFSS